MTTPSANNLAVLLLTSPLLQEGGKGSGKDPVLTAVEYAQLAAVLHRKQHQPSDLINGSRQSLLGSLSSEFAAERLDRLLSAAFSSARRWSTGPTARSAWSVVPIPPTPVGSSSALSTPPRHCSTPAATLRCSTHPPSPWWDRGTHPNRSCSRRKRWCSGRCRRGGSRLRRRQGGG